MTRSIAVQGVSKRFDTLTALDGVDLELRPGRVHALVGENGAGKSTLTKILAGLERPSAGRVLVDGAEVVLRRRGDALRHGVGLVPQHLSLNPQMSLVENLVLTDTHPFARRRLAERRLTEVAERTGLPVRPRHRIGDLALAERQLAEFCLTIAQGARFLLLDEPTSALGPFETAGLFEQLRALARGGTGVLLITHRLDEVRAVADDVTVLRSGRRVLHAPVAEVDDDALVDAMVGAVPPARARRRPDLGPVRLVLDGVSTSATAGQVLRDVSLTVRAGEVLGVIGVAGNGQRELAGVAAGFIHPDIGRVLVDGKDVSGSPPRAFAAGLRYIPEDRAHGLLLDEPLHRSVALVALGDSGTVSRSGIRWERVVELTRHLVREHDVRPPQPHHRTGALSGGNQQKLLVGRELADRPGVVVLHGPTQGLDLHASASVRTAVVDAARAGSAVLLLSADTDEVQAVADRVAVLSRGRVSDQMDVVDLTAERLGRAMAGLTVEGAR